MSYTYTVVLKKSEEGIAISCPSLPGCWSQGNNEQDALNNIKIAIEEYLQAIETLTKNEDIRKVEVFI